MPGSSSVWGWSAQIREYDLVSCHVSSRENDARVSTDQRSECARYLRARFYRECCPNYLTQSYLTLESREQQTTESNSDQCAICKFETENVNHRNAETANTADNSPSNISFAANISITKMIHNKHPSAIERGAAPQLKSDEFLMWIILVIEKWPLKVLYLSQK